MGWFRGHSITILLDSSSSTNSFLDINIVESLSGIQPLQSLILFKVANGGSIAFTTQIQYGEWSIQGYTFHSTLKLIGTYYMIIGMD